MVGTVIDLAAPSNDHPPRTGVAGSVRVHVFSIVAARLLRQARFAVVKFRTVVAVRIRVAAANTLQLRSRSRGSRLTPTLTTEDWSER